MITDVLGRVLRLSEPPRRVVSLVPSVTETLFDLGVGDTVVGITDYCIFPSELDRPRLGGTKNPRIDEIAALAPDLVHMNLEENLERHAEAVSRFAAVFVSEPKSVEDVQRLLRQLGQIHDCTSRAEEWIAAIGKELRVPSRRTFTFACPIWKEPWMWCGGDTYVSRLVESVGGRNVVGEHRRYPKIDIESILTMRPDVVFLPDEPYLFTEEDASAIEGARTVGPFPGHLFTWHGSRTLLGLRFLRDRI